MFYACASTAPVEDPSRDAALEGDLTLVGSACTQAPGQGFDVCRVAEGTKVSGDWLLVIPQGATTLGGELHAIFKDTDKTYAIAPGSKTFSLPWRDFFSESATWTQGMNGSVMALLTLQWKDGQGVVQTSGFRGLAYVNVLKAGYSRLPIGSSLSAWKTNCQIEYTTAGRSAVKCK